MIDARAAFSLIGLLVMCGSTTAQVSEGTVSLQVLVGGQVTSPDTPAATIPLGQSVQLRVIVTHLDGTISDITNDPKTAYFSLTPWTLFVSKTGLVTATTSSKLPLGPVDIYQLALGRTVPAAVSVTYGRQGDAEIGYMPVAFEIAPKPNDVTSGTMTIRAPRQSLGLAFAQTREGTVTLQVLVNGQVSSPSAFAATIPLGQSLQLQVLVTHLDGTVSDVTTDPKTAYRSIDTSLLQVSATGLVTATLSSTESLTLADSYELSVGRAVAVGVFVSYGYASDPETGFMPVALLVAPKQNDVTSGSVSIVAPTQSLVLGGMAQLTITRQNPDGSSTDVTAASAGTTYSSMSSGSLVVAKNGLVTRIGSGPSTLTASVTNGNDIGTISFQAADPSLGPGLTLQVTASKAQIHEGDSVQLQVLSQGSGNTGQNLTSTSTGTVYTTFYGDHEDDGIMAINQGGLGTTVNPIRHGEYGTLVIVARNGSAVGWTSVQVYPANQQIFDSCLQDSSSANFVLLNSTTGDYLFTVCGTGGFSVKGKGTLSKSGSTVTITDNQSDRRVSLTLNGQGTGGGTITLTIATGVYQTYHIVATAPHSNCQCGS